MAEPTKQKRPQSLLKRYSRYIGGLATLLVVGFLMYYFSSIVTWVVLAWVISLLGSPIFSLLGRIRFKFWVLPNGVKAILVLLFFYSILFLLFYLFVPVIFQQGRQLADVDYKSIINSLEEPIEEVNDWLIRRGFIEGDVSDVLMVSDSLGQQAVDSIPSPPPKPPITTTAAIQLDSLLAANGDTSTRTTIQLNLVLNLETPITTVVQDSAALAQAKNSPNDKVHEQMMSMLAEYINPSAMITSSVVYLVSFLGNLMVLLTSVTFIAFFFLKDEKLFGRAIKAFFPKRRQAEMDTALANIRRLLTRYFSGILVQITLITIYVTVLLSFFGVPNAFLIALFAAIINVIPYLGPFLGALFAALVIVSANINADFYAVTFPLLLRAAGVFASMQIVDGFILQPYIFSNSVSAHPLEIFLVVVIGAMLGGITGMIVAIPVYTIIRVVAAVFLKEFQIVQKLTQRLSSTEDDPPLEENVDIEVEG